MRNSFKILFALATSLSATAFASSDHRTYTGYTNMKHYDFFYHEDGYVPCRIQVYGTKNPNTLRIFLTSATNYEHNISVDLYRRVSSNTFATGPVNSRKRIYFLEFKGRSVKLYDSRLDYTCEAQLRIRH